MIKSVLVLVFFYLFQLKLSFNCIRGIQYLTDEYFLGGGEEGDRSLINFFSILTILTITINYIFNDRKVNVISHIPCSYVEIILPPLN